MLTACRHCGAEFVSSASRRQYCRQACYVAFMRQAAAESLIARFWAKVNKNGPIHPTLGTRCWLWTGAKGDGFGHGAFTYRENENPKQIHVYAHRFAWTLTNGPVPDNLSVLHACDVAPCCRPIHLFTGTQRDNLADARAKGRLVLGRHLIKVSDAGIADILANYRPRINGKQLAAHYGITLASLLRIVNGTQRVSQRTPVFERVHSVHVPILGEVA